MAGCAYRSAAAARDRVWSASSRRSVVFTCIGMFPIITPIPVSPLLLIRRPPLLPEFRLEKVNVNLLSCIDSIWQASRKGDLLSNTPDVHTCYKWRRVERYNTCGGEPCRRRLVYNISRDRARRTIKYNVDRQDADIGCQPIARSMLRPNLNSTQQTLAC